MKRCPRCPRLIPRTARYCATHQREYDSNRGTSNQRGYGSAHQRLRAGFQRRLDSGETFACSLCGQLVTSADVDWQLGHTDDRSGYDGPQHRTCNESDGGRRGARARA